MLVKKSAIAKETREFLRRDIDERFKYEEGSDLQSIINEVLHDKDIFTFLAINLPENHGLKLGHCRYFDDTIVYVHYGLTLDFRIPRKTTLFNYESFNEIGLEREESAILYLTSSIGCLKGLEHYPVPDLFVKQVNGVLQDPRPYLIELNFKKKIYL